MSASVTSVSEIIGLGGDQSSTATEFTRAFLVKISEPSAIAADLALTASAGGTAIPTIGDAWPNAVAGRSTPTARSKSAKIHDSNSRLLWVVEVKYSNESSGATTGSTETNTAPWNRTPQYRSAPVNYDIALEQDNASTPILVRNSAGDAFDPVPTYTHSNRMHTITRNSLFFSESNAEALSNSVNDSAFAIRGNVYARGELRLVNWSAQTAEWTNDQGATFSYYEETIEIEASTFEHGHKLKVLDQGYRYKDGSDVKRIMDDSSPARPVPEPVLLDGAGGIGSDSSPQFLEFDRYRYESWGVLGSL